MGRAVEMPNDKELGALIKEHVLAARFTGLSYSDFLTHYETVYGFPGNREDKRNTKDHISKLFEALEEENFHEFLHGKYYPL